MIETILHEPRMKERKITLHLEELGKQLDRLTYKYSKSAVADPLAADEVASDVDDNLDGPIISRLFIAREAQVRRRLAFCLIEEEQVEVDNCSDLEGDIVFRMRLPESFTGSSLKVGCVYINDFIVKGALMDWYKEIGSPYADALKPEVDVLESRIVDIFRVPSVVPRGIAPYVPSYKIR